VNRSSVQRTNEGYAMKAREVNMRLQKRFTRWRTDNEEQEQQPEGRHALKNVTGRLNRFWRRRRGSQPRDHDDCSIHQCVSALAHGLF